MRVRHPHRALIQSAAALATVSEPGVRSFCDHDAVFALRSSCRCCMVCKPPSMPVAYCAVDGMVEIKSKSAIGLGMRRSIFSSGWHDRKRKVYLPDGRLHDMCVVRKEMSHARPPPHHLHPPRARVVGRCLQMLRVCNILHCIGHDVCDTAHPDLLLSSLVHVQVSPYPDEIPLCRLRKAPMYIYLLYFTGPILL